MTNEHHGIEVFTRRRTRRAAAQATRPNKILGLVALLAALATILLFWMGMSFAVGERNLVSTDLAYLATGMSVVAIVAGGSAIVLRRGRALGAIAIVLGLLANPLLLTRFLNWAGGLG
jgi:CBS domain containing-hemolysin-like protein